MKWNDGRLIVCIYLLALGVVEMITPSYQLLHYSLLSLLLAIIGFTGKKTIIDKICIIVGIVGFLILLVLFFIKL
ncbi:DMSO/TMAO reductase YedYZ heme-binding membrane subunit [Scopulibacillus daqui]|uniref:DMSO/TMAO reductase YedYZ heme-binding membrane subunit n=1 Tax=Scopulibacillus daqui TaxID=1469162 RepID=A0ABS2PYF5_9BACL|nr:DMSO/TMAO reductase YedYZ heme-binding membrane subunit [Scopulibacillus daqui]